jgi:hypothetical protein
MKEEDSESNNILIGKVLIQKCLFVIVILASVSIFIVITSLREDPLSTGILEVFLFQKYRI